MIQQPHFWVQTQRKRIGVRKGDQQPRSRQRHTPRLGQQHSPASASRQTGKEDALCTHNGTLLSLYKMMGICHLQPHEWAWRTLFKVKLASRRKTNTGWCHLKEVAEIKLISRVEEWLPRKGRRWKWKSVVMQDQKVLNTCLHNVHRVKNTVLYT